MIAACIPGLCAQPFKHRLEHVTERPDRTDSSSAEFPQTCAASRVLKSQSVLHTGSTYGADTHNPAMHALILGMFVTTMYLVAWPACSPIETVLRCRQMGWSCIPVRSCEISYTLPLQHLYEVTTLLYMPATHFCATRVVTVMEIFRHPILVVENQSG